MKKLASSIILIFKRKDSFLVFLLSFLFLVLLIFSIENGKEAIHLLNSSSFSLSKRLDLFMLVFFDWKSIFTINTLILFIAGSILGGINISLAFTYIKLRGKIILKSGLYSGFGLVLAFLGIGCAACGTAFISILLSFFGLGGILTILPYKGEEIGYLGITIIFIATYTLAQKVMSPNVC